MLRKHQPVERPNSGIQVWPTGTVVDEELHPRIKSIIPQEQVKFSIFFANLEFCLFIFGICTVWCAFVLILLKSQKFPIQKHFIEVIMMVLLPVIVSFLCLYCIDQWVNRKNMA